MSDSAFLRMAGCGSGPGLGLATRSSPIRTDFCLWKFFGDFGKFDCSLVSIIFNFDLSLLKLI